MTALKVIEFPEQTAQSVVAGLRTLAQSVEDGKFGDAHNLVWVIDAGDGVIHIGLLGQTPNPGATAHLLMGCGQHKVVSGSMDES